MIQQLARATHKLEYKTVSCGGTWWGGRGGERGRTMAHKLPIFYVYE